MRHFHDPGLDVSRKANDEIVTTADKEADEAIRAQLSRAFPQDKLLTEESFDPTQPIDLSQTWIVDPLDATRNFANKIPHFAVSLAYLENGQPKLGVIYDPLKDEMFTAVKGEPTRLNGRAIQVNKDTALEKSVVSLPFPYPKRILDTKIPNRRLGCAALDMAYVAAGRLGAASERNLKVWDVVAGLPLLEGAGGSLTDATGNPLDLTQKRFHYVASNTRLHEPMLRLLQDA
jgi:myo-inositol-1(or 4)-monophosphatase